MDWSQILTIVGAHIAIFLWLRTETRADHKRALDLIEAIKDDVKNFNQKFYDESKDFHGRLCAIEEKYKQITIPKIEINQENK